MKLPINRSRLRDWHYIVALKAPLVLVVIVLGVAVLVGCQSGPTITCGDDCRIEMGDNTQDRGRQTTDAVNPRVDATTGDIDGLPGLP